MAVAAQRRTQAVGARGRQLLEQPGQAGGLLARRGLGDDLGGRGPDPGKGLQRARGDPAFDLARRQLAEHRRGPPERPDAVRRGPAPLQLERDPPQRLPWVHW